MLYIMKTYLHNFDLIKTHFYIVKLGFRGIYIFFFFDISAHIDCEYPQSMFWAEIWKKYQNFYLKTFSFGGEIFNIFE